jgi:RhtB (resistance to homoserine/threonine) family protein
MIETIANHLPILTKVFFLQLFAAMSPGPDFAIVVRNSLIYSRQVALATTMGITGGIFIHISYSLFGLGALMVHAPAVMSTLQCLGGGYLIYLGYHSIKAGKKSRLSTEEEKPRKTLTKLDAFWTGFITNALNPKAMFFLLSTFSVVITQDTPKIILGLFGIEVLFITITWFSCVSLFLSIPHIQRKFIAYSHWIERITGIILLTLGLNLMISRFLW